MVGVAKPLRRVQQAAQQLFAFEQRGVAKVVSVAIKNVEREVNDRRLAYQHFAGGAHVHALLQALKVAAPARIERHNLAVENRLARGENFWKRRQFRIALGDVNVVARAQRQRSIPNPRQGADAVPLNLEEPARIGERMLGERRQHWLDARRHRAFARALQLDGADLARTALRRRLLGNLLDAPPCQNRAVVLINIPLRIFGGVFVFDEQPLVAFFAALQLDQDEAAAQLLSIQAEFNLASLQLQQRVEARRLGLTGIVFHDKRSAVPDHDASRAVVAFGNLALEAAILQRMILGHHCKPFVGIALRRPLRHRPGLQRAVNRQPEVVVQPRRGMLLHHERVSVLRGGTDFQPQLRHWLGQARTGPLRLACRGGPALLRFLRFTRRLRRAVKLPLSPVFFELRHGCILPHGLPDVVAAYRHLSCEIPLHGCVPQWKELVYTAAILEVANKRLRAYGTWKNIRKTGSSTVTAKRGAPCPPPYCWIVIKTRTCKLGSSQLVEKKEVQKVWQNGSNSQMIENREREKCVRSGYGFGVSEAILCYHKITSLPRKI